MVKKTASLFLLLGCFSRLAVAEIKSVRQSPVEISCGGIVSLIYDTCIFNACNSVNECKNYAECEGAIEFCLSEAPKCEEQREAGLRECMPPIVEEVPELKPEPDPMFSRG